MSLRDKIISDRNGIGERMNDLQRRVDSGRFTGAEKQELERLLIKYIELDNLAQEKEALEAKRDALTRALPKFSETELEILVQLVGEGLRESFKAGNHEKTERLQSMKDRLKSCASNLRMKNE